MCVTSHASCGVVMDTNEAIQQERNECSTDFLALGMGGTNMMMMLWTVAMGKRAIGVEMRGDPFLLMHWNVRADFYHQLGMLDQMMIDRYGEEGLPRRANGEVFSLSECFYNPKKTSGFIVADEVINEYDKVHNLAGTIRYMEFIDERWKDGKPNRTVTTIPGPVPPEEPNQEGISTTVTDMLNGPPTFQVQANSVLILLRRYLEAIEALDQENGREPRVRLFPRHQVCSSDEGFERRESDGCLSVNLVEVQELDFRGELVQVPVTDGTRITINAPELCVVAQGSNSRDAKRLGFQQKDVEFDHNDGRGLVVAQADFLAGLIDVLVDGRVRRRIASAFDEHGNEYWVRQMAVGHEGDPQVGWVVIQVPDFEKFDPVKAGFATKGVDKKSPQYLAGYRRCLYEFYIQEASKLLEISKEELKDIRMAYGPKPFSVVERTGDNPRIAPNVVVAGDSFGSGHFLTNGGAMTGMVSHSMAVLKYWKGRADGASVEEAHQNLAEDITKATKEWLEHSRKEFSQSSPVNFGIEGRNKVAQESHIDVNSHAKSIDASHRMRFKLSVQDPCDWRRPAMTNGRVYTAGLKQPR